MQTSLYPPKWGNMQHKINMSVNLVLGYQLLAISFYSMKYLGSVTFFARCVFPKSKISYMKCFNWEVGQSHICAVMFVALALVVMLSTWQHFPVYHWQVIRGEEGASI